MFKLFRKTKKTITTKKWTLLNLDTLETEIVIGDSVMGSVVMGYYDILAVEDIEIER